MKKLLSGFVAAALGFTLVMPVPAQAAPAAYTVYVNGSRIDTGQSPVYTQGRVLLPMAAIFQSLGASVSYDYKTKKVSAYRGGDSVILTLGSKAATVNGRTVYMDVPARAMGGRTMVPVRFVSESLGATINYDNNTRVVRVTSGSSSTNPDRPTYPDRPTTPDYSGNLQGVNYVTVQISGQSGDASDIRVSFSKESNEYNLDHYRVMIVKASNSFNLSKARAVSSSNYTVVNKNGDDAVVKLDYRARDVDGDSIRTNVKYEAYVLSVGRSSSEQVLSNSSSTFTLGDNAVAAATNVQVRNVANYNDGRDMQVSFTRPSSDSQIQNYRIMVVKTKDASRFDAYEADRVSSQNYTTVSKSSNSTLTTTLSSNARDTSGDLIRNNVSYTVFVVSVSNTSSYGNKLSSSSSSFTLGQSAGVPVITKVSQVGNYGDGRDIQISFNRSSDESRVSYYRIFAVKYSDAYRFDLTEANRVSSSNYYDVSKNGYSITSTLPSNMRDVNGSLIRRGETYRLFVMSVSNSNSDYNALSGASDSINISNNSTVYSASNVRVSNVGDYNDGRDMMVTFNRASDESNISQYRIMVVKSSRSYRFDVSEANNVSSYNYTSVNTNGRDISLKLSSTARDVDGDLIRNGISYQVYVLSVGRGSYVNSLSSSSDSITLSNNSTIYPATNVSASSMGGNYNDGRNMGVTFNRAADESNVNHYRVMVVKSSNASRFNLTEANRVNSWNSTVVNRNGSSLSTVLGSDARDVDGAPIRNGISYRVFVLSVSANNQANNALSAPSPEVTLRSNASVDVVTNVEAKVIGGNGNASDIEVGFAASSNNSYVNEYRIMVVRADQSYAFDTYNAGLVSSSSYIRVGSQSGYVRQSLTSSLRDVQGNAIQKGIAYRVFVLTVADNRSGSSNALSSPSGEFSLVDQSVQAPTNVFVAREGVNDFKAYFSKPSSDNGIAYYGVMVVPSGSADSFNLDQANRVAGNNYKLVSVSGDGSTMFSLSDNDVYGNPIRTGVAYKAFVVSVADGRNATVNALSNGSNEIVVGN